MEERRRDHSEKLEDARGRIGRLETLREADKEFYNIHFNALKEIGTKVERIEHFMTSSKAERNTLIAVAAIAGSCVTWLAKGIFSLIFSSIR